MPIWAFQKRIIGNPTPEKAAFVSSFADCDELFVINQRFPNLVTQRPSFTASLVRCFSFACVLICSVKFRS